MKTTIKYLTAIFMLLFLFTGCGGDSDADPSEPSEPTVQGVDLVHNFESNGTQKRIYVEIRNFPNIPTATTEAWKEQIATYAEEAWRKYELYGFKSPSNGIDIENTEILKLFLDKGVGGYSGSTGGGEWIRLQGPALEEGRLIDLKATVTHEMFHNIQFKYALARYSNTLTEGTATLIAPLLDADLHQELSTNTSCDSMYLRSPTGNLWFRPAGSEEHNVCTSSLWWRYLTQQFSEMEARENDQGIDTLLALFKHLERDLGWRQRAIDKVLFTGDFNGNSVEDILVQSDTHIGVTSPLLYNSTTVDVVANEGRFSNQWRYQEADEIVASCDINRDQKADFIVKSDTHLGIIGMENSQFKTIASLAYGNQLGTEGWRLQENDKILDAQDFDRDGQCEFLIQSATHFGIIEYNDTSFKTLYSKSLNTRVDDNGWKLSAEDRVIGSGDLNGDGQRDFVLQSSSHIGILSYNLATRELITLGSALFRASENDQFFVGRLKEGAPERLVLTSPSGVRVLGLNENNQIAEIFMLSPTQIGNTFANTLTLAKFIGLVDMDGNGEKELLVRAEDGSLVVGKLDTPNSFLRLAQVSSETELNDGFNGSQYRTKWQPNSEYKILSEGDFDGDGRDELFIRDNSRTFVLDLNISTHLFTVHTQVNDNQRSDSLIQRMDAFIQDKSSGRRNLRSFFKDFSLANYLNALEGDIDEKYKYSHEVLYPNSIDFDHRTSTAPVKFTEQRVLEGRGADINMTQESWSTNYFEFSTAQNSIMLSAQINAGIKNASYTLLVVEGNRLIRKVEHEGKEFLRTLILEENQKIILIVTSFDAPLEYTVNSISR